MADFSIGSDVRSTTTASRGGGHGPLSDRTMLMGMFSQSGSAKIVKSSQRPGPRLALVRRLKRAVADSTSGIRWTAASRSLSKPLTPSRAWAGLMLW